MLFQAKLQAEDLRPLTLLPVLLLYVTFTFTFIPKGVEINFLSRIHQVVIKRLLRGCLFEMLDGIKNGTDNFVLSFYADFFNHDGITRRIGMIYVQPF